MNEKFCILFCTDVRGADVLLALEALYEDLYIVNADELRPEDLQTLLCDLSRKICLYTSSLLLADSIKAFAVNQSVRIYTTVVFNSHDCELRPSNSAWTRELCVDVSTVASNLCIGAARHFAPRKYACAV